jgi:hypothetical protein
LCLEELSNTTMHFSYKVSVGTRGPMQKFKRYMQDMNVDVKPGCYGKSVCWLRTGCSDGSFVNTANEPYGS